MDTSADAAMAVPTEGCGRSTGAWVLSILLQLLLGRVTGVLPPTVSRLTRLGVVASVGTNESHQGVVCLPVVDVGPGVDTNARVGVADGGVLLHHDGNTSREEFRPMVGGSASNKPSSLPRLWYP